MFTHLLMESSFGESYELGRTPKLAGPLLRGPFFATLPVRAASSP